MYFMYSNFFNFIPHKWQLRETIKNNMFLKSGINLLTNLLKMGFANAVFKKVIETVIN